MLLAANMCFVITDDLYGKFQIIDLNMVTDVQVQEYEGEYIVFFDFKLKNDDATAYVKCAVNPETLSWFQEVRELVKAHNSERYASYEGIFIELRDGSFGGTFYELYRFKPYYHGYRLIARGDSSIEKFLTLAKSVIALEGKFENARYFDLRG